MNRTDALHRRLWLRRVKLLGGMGVAAALGITTVGGLAHFTDLGIRQLEDHALAGSDGPQSVAAEPGDSRIVWLDLPTSLASPVVSDGESGWFAVAEALTDEGPFRSGLYQYVPAQGRLSRISTFLGRPTALVMAGDGFAVGAGQTVLLIDRAGSVRLVQGDAVGSLNADTYDRYVSALAVVGEHLYAANSSDSSIAEIDLATGTVVRRIDLGPVIPPPTQLIDLGGRLLASTPFGRVDGPGPGSTIVDLGSGDVSLVDIGRPFSFSKDASGSIFVSQAVPDGGVRVLSFSDGRVGAAVSPRGNSIDWDGRWDLIAVAPDSSIWAAVGASGKIIHEEADAAVDVYDLPLTSVVPSVPYGAKPPLDEDDARRLSTARRSVASMTTLSDGSLVFISDSPGGKLGYIPAD